VELKERGLHCKQELAVPIIYKNYRFDSGFRLDLLVEDKVIVELKSVEHLMSIHEAQLLTYLRLFNKQVGLLINFNVSMLKNGVRRCVLKAVEASI
jgi:GxxExxY protein